MNKGVHLMPEGLQQIINIKASLNLGVSDTIKSEFSQINPVDREIIETTNIPDPNWISGFVSGEGNFDAGIRKTSNVLGYRVYLRFRISQHERDTRLLELIINYLGAGRLEKDGRKPLIYLIIGNLSDYRYRASNNYSFLAEQKKIPYSRYKKFRLPRLV